MMRQITTNHQPHTILVNIVMGWVLLTAFSYHLSQYHPDSTLNEYSAFYPYYIAGLTGLTALWGLAILRKWTRAELPLKIVGLAYIGFMVTFSYTHPEDGIPVLITGISVALLITGLKRLIVFKQKRYIILSLIGAAPLALQMLIIAFPQSLYTVTVSTTTPMPGQDITITLKSSLWAPMGSYYIHLAQEDLSGAQEGRVHAYNKPYGTQHEFIYEAGKVENSQCHHCMEDLSHLLGTYTLSIDIPHPLLPKTAINVKGPHIQIAQSQVQIANKHLEDEVVFLHQKICEAIPTPRYDNSLSQLRGDPVKSEGLSEYELYQRVIFKEADFCGGFSMMRAATDTDTPVLKEKGNITTETYRDRNPPLHIDGTALCSTQTSRPPYTNTITVCIPYMPQPNAIAYHEEMVTIDLTWGGHRRLLDETNAIGLAQSLIHEKTQKYRLAIDPIRRTTGPEWQRLEDTWFATLPVRQIHTSPQLNNSLSSILSNGGEESTKPPITQQRPGLITFDENGIPISNHNNANPIPEEPEKKEKGNDTIPADQTHASILINIDHSICLHFHTLDTPITHQAMNEGSISCHLAVPGLEDTP